MFLVSSRSCLRSIHWSQVENGDVVGAAPTGDAPTTSELSTTLLPTKERLILEFWRYSPKCDLTGTGTIIQITGTYNWKHTWNHTVSNHPIHQHGHTNFWYVSWKEYISISKNGAMMCSMYIINGVHGPEPRSSGGNTSSNPQVSALIPRPAFNEMERMCQRHGSNQNSHPPVLVRKPLCNQFIHYHISSRGVLGINRFKLRNFAVVAIECSLATVYRGIIMARIHRWSVMIYGSSGDGSLVPVVVMWLVVLYFLQVGLMKFWLLKLDLPWRSRSIAPKTIWILTKVHLWSKFGDPSLNGWWVIVRKSSKRGKWVNLNF